MFGDLDCPLKALRKLSASAELLCEMICGATSATTNAHIVALFDIMVGTSF